jgi:hypothetical protein
MCGPCSTKPLTQPGLAEETSGLYRREAEDAEALIIRFYAIFASMQCNQ